MAQNQWQIHQTFVHSFSGNLALFCSDERFVDATMEFLKHGCGLSRCDLLVTPGGPAFIAEKNELLLHRLRFLAEHHHLKRLVLVAHEDCGHYKIREKKLTPDELKKKQREETMASAERMRNEFPGVIVDPISAGWDEWGFVFTRLGD